ncbi:hypothetical protein U1Q18_021631, partial [Sarracenia purpurea var. burkii]
MHNEFLESLRSPSQSSPGPRSVSRASAADEHGCLFWLESRPPFIRINRSTSPITVAVVSDSEKRLEGFAVDEAAFSGSGLAYLNQDEPFSIKLQRSPVTNLEILRPKNFRCGLFQNTEVLHSRLLGIR